MGTNDHKKVQRSFWVVVGVGLTALYAGAICYLLAQSGSNALIQVNASLQLNTFGDFLAGLCAPLAFLWLFVATMIQSQELALQRQELEENRTVMKEQAAEAKRTAEFIDTQADLLREQIKQHKWENADALFRAKAAHLEKWARSYLQATVTLSDNARPSARTDAVGSLVVSTLPTEPEVALPALIDNIRRVRKTAHSMLDTRPGWVLIPHSKSQLNELQVRLVQLADLVHQLSPELAEFAEPLDLPGAAEELDPLIGIAR